uniref:EF-hand domain-containing protein n=1 Tax=Stomoxys calcitrans TaxID=35570 RepID=A0A1I8PUA8_STOCA
MHSLTRISQLLVLVITLSEALKYAAAVKRGPHHPRSERKVDQHLTHEEHRIEDDLKEMGIQASVENMSEEEKNFYYFKIHDGDNNNALDGLELLQAAMHQDEHFKTIDRDNFIQKANDELNHIIDVIDEFLVIADANKDGFLHYNEYVRAVTGTSD